MKKSELIKELEQLKGDPEVVVVSYRGVIQRIEKVYYGRHESTEEVIVIRG